MFDGSYVEPDVCSYYYSQTDTKAAAFETANGESILVYYSPMCQGDSSLASSTEHVYMQSKMCANFVYDLNGNKGPNTVGKDIGFISALYPTDSVVVAPMPLLNSAGRKPQKEGGVTCKAQDPESRMPNRDEAAAFFYNKLLLGINLESPLWTSSLFSSKIGWQQSYKTGLRFIYDRDFPNIIHCVKR